MLKLHYPDVGDQTMKDIVKCIGTKELRPCDCFLTQCILALNYMNTITPLDIIICLLASTVLVGQIHTDAIGARRSFPLPGAHLTTVK